MYQRILVPFDGSPTSARGLDEAIRVAGLTHGRLRLFHVIDELSLSLAMDAVAGYAGDWISTLRDKGGALLAQGRTIAEAAGIDAEVVLSDKLSDSVHDQITAEAAGWPADLIVLGTHGRRGAGRFLMGSSAEQVLRHATVPVLLVRAPEVESKVEAPACATSKTLDLPSGALAYE